MRERDRAILEGLRKFNVLSRDDIVDLYFSSIKNGVKSANAVLKRMRRDGYIDANTSQQPYLYFPSPSPIKTDSSKIPHFLAIVDVYKQLCSYEQPASFIVEPHYGKEYMQPDLFVIWKGAPFFIEVQQSIYSDRIMNEKIKRYEAYFHSREWHNEHWQPKGNPIFPYVLILSDIKYKIESVGFRVLQFRSIKEMLMNTVSPEVPQKSKNSEVKAKIGTNVFYR